MTNNKNSANFIERAGKSINNAARGADSWGKRKRTTDQEE